MKDGHVLLLALLSIVAGVIGYFLYAPLQPFATGHPIWQKPAATETYEPFTFVPGTKAEDVLSYPSMCFHDVKVLRHFKPLYLQTPEERAEKYEFLTPEELQCVLMASDYLPQPPSRQTYAPRHPARPTR